MDAPAKFQRFLERLKNVKEHASGKCWSASCPAHPHDEKPSLSINIGEKGNLVVACHSAAHGCMASDIVKSVGLTMSDLFLTDRPGFERKMLSRPKPDIVHPYQYEDGSLAYETCRYNNPKNFAQRRPNPDWRPGHPAPRYIWNLDDVRFVLYRLPTIMKEMESGPNRWVILVEGEKNADLVSTLSMISTTHALGSDHWRSEYALPLAGRNVAIFYDCDPYYEKQRKRPGQAWAVQAARDLVSVGSRVRICRPPECPDDSKFDVADFISHNYRLTQDELRARLLSVINATLDYFPGWEHQSGYHSLQESHRIKLSDDVPADMNDAFELVRRRLAAAIDGVRLSTLASDLAEASAWCQWLAETLSPGLKCDNIRLGPTPADISARTSEPESRGAVDAQNAIETQNATEAVCVQAQTEDDEPEPI